MYVRSMSKMLNTLLNPICTTSAIYTHGISPLDALASQHLAITINSCCSDDANRKVPPNTLS
jgi:hypothetical protein